VAIYPIPFVRGGSRTSPNRSSPSLTRSVTRNHPQFNVRPSLSGYRIGTSSVLQKQVRSYPHMYAPNIVLTPTQGSGKTAAFVIPMLTFISNMPPFTEENRHLGPYGLVMAPTRELAQQIESEARKFATPLGFRCVSIVGGVCF
jgi:RAD3-like DEAD/DEAH box helicase